MDLSSKSGGGRTGYNPVLIILGTVVVLVGGYLISLLSPSLFPLAASAEAGPIDQLFRVMLFLGGVVFVLVEGLIILSIVRFRARKGEAGDGANFNGNVTLEVIWTAIPAVVVVFITLYSYQVWVDIQAPKDDELVIETEGLRFVWSFSYTDPLNRLAEADTQNFTDSVLHTYVGRPVRLKMETRDVNHAFWVPTMRIKQDLLAGRQTEVAFTPTEAGRYRIVCTELCGGGHGAMYSYIQVYATEQEWMERFIDVRVERILNPPTDPLTVGFNLLNENAYPCSGCHVLESVNWAGVTGPTLNGIGDTAARRASANGLGGAEEYIAQAIRHPNAYIVPGYNSGVMPQFGAEQDEPDAVDGAYYVYMSDDSLTAIVTYLCLQTATGESACGDEAAIRAAVEAQ
ncbi:MAG: cytochrome c oxidase subunit II [Anaerolineae bacterium]|jgi:cytochrome c oxidase subunit 2|nr:cytochrome c oxidase subunit II [Anaerolineae bacterium]